MLVYDHILGVTGTTKTSGGLLRVLTADSHSCRQNNWGRSKIQVTLFFGSSPFSASPTLAHRIFSSFSRSVVTRHHFLLFAIRIFRPRCNILFSLRSLGFSELNSYFVKRTALIFSAFSTLHQKIFKHRTSSALEIPSCVKPFRRFELVLV